MKPSQLFKSMNLKLQDVEEIECGGFFLSEEPLRREKIKKSSKDECLEDMLPITK